MTDAELAWRVEAVCFNAFPSLKQAILEGWLLRFSKGVSRRANSANPLHPSFTPAHAVIEQIEAVYRRQGQPTIFRVPSFLAAALDELYPGLGEHLEEETTVAIDGEIHDAPGYFQRIRPGCEVFFIPKLEGG